MRPVVNKWIKLSMAIAFKILQFILGKCIFRWVRIRWSSVKNSGRVHTLLERLWGFHTYVYGSLKKTDVSRCNLGLKMSLAITSEIKGSIWIFTYLRMACDSAMFSLICRNIKFMLRWKGYVGWHSSGSCCHIFSLQTSFCPHLKVMSLDFVTSRQANVIAWNISV